MQQAAIGIEVDREGRRINVESIRRRGMLAVGRRLLERQDAARAEGRSLPKLSSLEVKALLLAHEADVEARGLRRS